MPCFHPLHAYQASTLNSEGKRPVIFTNKSGFNPIKLPCGQCVGCRLERSRQWAIRCMHEASLYEDNCFITLTFNDDALFKRENPWSLDVRDFQKFMKRLRKKYGADIRFYHCGEYGDQYGRPHYHACIFNFDFPDKKLWKIVNDQRLYISDSLQDLWSCPKTKEPLGFCTIGTVTFESAAYVARYIMKKINGDMADDHYVDADGVCIKPEYTTMSRRPGIGKGWYDKYRDETYNHDSVIVRGIEMRPPRYYDNQLKADRPYQFEEVKNDRLTNAEQYADNNTRDRLEVREYITHRKLGMLPRKVE